jgi:hypothetical protein
MTKTSQKDLQRPLGGASGRSDEGGCTHQPYADLVAPTVSADQGRLQAGRVHSPHQAGWLNAPQ